MIGSSLASSGARFWCLAFLCLCAPVCVALALIVPLGEVADESSHLARAVALAQGTPIGHRESLRYSDGSTHEAAGVRIAPVWEEIARSRPVDVAGTLHPVDRAPDAAGRIFVPLYTIATYPPVLYGPGAAGLALGRAVGLGPEASALLGRLAHASAYLALGIAALAFARRGRAMLFALLALPMSLSLAASFNQDALVIALSALAGSLLTPRPFAGPGTAARLAGASLCLALVALAKPPYAALAAMVLVPLPDGMTGAALARWARPRLPALALIVLPAALWTVAATQFVATPVPRPAYEAGPLWSGHRPATFSATDPKAQAQVLAEKPSRLLILPGHFFATLKHETVLFKGAVGIFGWLDRPLPFSLYGLWAVALVGPLLAARRGMAPPWPEGLILTAATLGCLWLIVLSQYLTWTAVGENRVDGPQGRYLLPLVPMLIVAFARAPSGPGSRAALLPVLAAAVDLVALPLVAMGMRVPA